MIELLKEQGMLLPEDEWGKHSLESTVAEVPLAVATVLGVAALAVAFLGGGRPVTWVGCGVFLVLLVGVVWLCDRAVSRQAARTRGKRAALRRKKNKED